MSKTIVWRTKSKEELINRLVLEQLLSELSQKEQNLIRWRYFDDKTQMEVAALMGISQVQVSRLEKKILVTLRQKMNK